VYSAGRINIFSSKTIFRYGEREKAVSLLLVVEEARDVKQIDKGGAHLLHPRGTFRHENFINLSWHQSASSEYSFIDFQHRDRYRSNDAMRASRADFAPHASSCAFH